MMKNQEGSDGGRFWAVQNGLLSRLNGKTAEEVASLVADTAEKSADAVKEARALNEDTKKALTKIESISTTWQADQKQLQEHLSAGTFDQAAMEKAAVAIWDRQRAEDLKNGALQRSVQAQHKKVTDPWAEKGDYLAWAMKKGEENDPRKLLTAAVLATPSSDTHRWFQRQSFDMQIIHALAYGEAMKLKVSPGELLAERMPNVLSKWAEYQRAMLAEFGVETKAALDPIDTATSGAASQWIPSPMASEVREMIMLEARVPSIFEHVLISTPGKTWTLPVDLTDVLPDYIPETTAYTNPYAASDPTQLGQVVNAANKVFTPAKVRGRLMWSGEFDEMSVIDAMPFMRRKLIRTHANGEERMLIDGQETTTIDTGSGGPGTYDIRKAVDGIRFFCSSGQANVLHNAGSDNLAYSDFTAARALMGEYGTFPDDLVIIAGPSTYLQLLNLAETKTVDAYGPQAAVLTGEIARMQGIPVVPSRYVRQDLNASGIFDATTTTQTICILVNRRTLLVAEKRQLTFEAVRLPQTDQWDLISMRSFDPQFFLGNTQKSAAVIYNVDTAIA